MTDRELLELAAKAAGYVLGKHTQKDWAFTYGGVEWNPLTDDGDALRLADLLEKAPAHTLEDGTITLYLGGTVVADKAAAELRRLVAQRDALLEALRLLNIECHQLHHNFKDRHDFVDPCPVVARIKAAIKAAEENT